MSNAILNETYRKQHANNESLGCGNFLHIAAEVSPFADLPHLRMDLPTKTFLGETFESFSLNQLKRVVDQYAGWYYGNGVRAKDPIAVYVSEGIGNLIHYLALNAIGAIPLIVNGNMPPDIAAKWFKKTGATGLYSDTEHLKAISPFIAEDAGFRFIVTDDTARATYQQEFPPIYPFQHQANDTVLVGHSSGTTGIPKAVEFQHQQFFYGIRYRLGLPFPPGSERVLSALPHSHSAGIAYLMLAILSGCETLVLSSNKPEVVLPSVETFKPSMFVAFPETYVLLSDSNLDAYDLSSIQLWFNGGDAAHEAHIRRLIAYGHHMENGNKVPGSIFVDGLGSSEMGFSLFRNIHTPTTERYDRCIGKPIEWVEATVLGDDGSKLPPYKVGRLGVKSPTITPGYWNDSVLTKRSQVNGYFLTGDLFYYDENGYFYHVDRIPDCIQTESGVVYSLETEEILMKNFPDISDCTVVAIPVAERDRGALAVVRLKPGKLSTENDLLQKFNQLLNQKGKKSLYGVRFATLKEVPLGPTGKVLKRELREQLRNIQTPSGNTRIYKEPLHA